MAISEQKKTEHIHKFKRHTYETGTKIFFCALPKCNKKLKVGLALGKECICWRCGNVFVMNEYSVRLAKPHCGDCHKSKDNNTQVVMNIPIVIPSVSNDTLPLAERLKKATTIEEDEEL